MKVYAKWLAISVIVLVLSFFFCQSSGQRGVDLLDGTLVTFTVVMVALGLIALAVWIYFIPATTAARRNHHNATAIFVFNLLLGWTFLGWALALVWSLTAPAPQTTIA
jgi:uncharacterized membrane protein